MRAIKTLIILLTFFGCRGKEQFVAVVNNQRITVAQFRRTLPQTIEPGKESTVVWNCLEEMINRELFVQEAERLGLDSVIAYPLELEKKGLMIYELFADLGRTVKPITMQELQNAYKLLSSEVHCRLIAVRDKVTADRLYQELKNDTAFETLAVRYSIHPSRNNCGDLGYIREYYIEEPLRSVILGLEIREWTKPVWFDSSYQIIQLLDRRAVDPPLPPFNEIKQQLEEQIKISRRRQAANEYIQNLRQRLVYNPAGLAVFYKPVDSITEAEKEIWVAVRDSSKYVKVGRLLYIARRFPPYLDTAVCTYAIKRAIEDDLMFEDALNRGLDKVPAVTEQLHQLRQKLLYETLYQRMITSQIEITDEQIRAYFEAHRDRYPNNDFNAVAPLIRNSLLWESRQARRNEFLRELHARSRVVVNEQQLKKILRETISQNSKGVKNNE